MLPMRKWIGAGVRIMLIALPFIFAVAPNAYPTPPDSSTLTMRLDTLTQKVDSLEANLSRLRFDLRDRSSTVYVAALKWGRGLGAGMKFHQLGFDINMRYTFRNGMEPKTDPGWFGYSRYSLVAGMRTVPDQDIPRFNMYTPGGATIAGFAGLRMSTPILKNLTSVEFGGDLYLADPRESWQPGWSQSVELQFWMSKTGHFDLGAISHIEYSQKDNRVMDLFRPYIGLTVSMF